VVITRFYRRVGAVFLFPLAIFFIGCLDRTLVQDISQKEALQILALLDSKGIPASLVKQSGGSSKFSILVSESDFAPGATLLNQAGLPEVAVASIADMLQSDSIIPSSRQWESARLSYLDSLQISALIESLPYVKKSTVLKSGDNEYAIVIRLQKVEKFFPRVAPEVAMQSIQQEVSNLIKRGTDNEGPLLKIRLYKDDDEILTSLPNKKYKRFLNVITLPEEEIPLIAWALLVATLVTAFAGAVLGYWLRDSGLFSGSLFGIPTKKAISITDNELRRLT
jgi:type III secretory pathway lipoprotein EscJ